MSCVWLCLFFIFNAEFISCMKAHEIEYHMGNPGPKQGCVRRSCVRQISQRKQRQELRRKRKRRRGSGEPVYGCAMCVLSACFCATSQRGCWKAGKALVYAITSHGNSSCQHVIPLGLKAVFLCTMLSSSHHLTFSLLITRLHLGSL